MRKDFHGLPPIIISAAGGEWLTGDAKALYEHVKAAGVEVPLRPTSTVAPSLTRATSLFVCFDVAVLVQCRFFSSPSLCK